MAKHTQGPWLCHPAKETDGKYCLYNNDGDYLTLEDDVHEANANLIAAAPDMLEALEDLSENLNIAIRSLDGEVHELMFESVLNAKRIIAKARGENV